jgi:hypothetical protein
MADAQRLVDDIRHFLQAGEHAASDAVRALAVEYAEACQQANNRLRRCEEYLRLGHRTEAIHFAQAEPPLLDVIALLDFPERPHWDQFVASCNLPQAPQLRLPTAEALNRAYAEVQPLEDLLRRHRLLALSRASLGERLAVLRQLAQLDPTNPVWDQDIAEFEAVRLRQIQAAADEARLRGDLRALPALYQELTAPGWKTPPAPAVVQTVFGLLQQETARQGQVALQQLAAQLHEAFGSRDEGRVRALLEQWHQQAAQAGLPPHDPLNRQAAQAEQWLAQRTRRYEEEQLYQQALLALEAGLRNPRLGLERLQELYQDVATLPGGVPEHLEALYNDRFVVLEAAGKRREYLILGLTFGGGILVLLIFFTVLFLRGCS